MRIIKTNAIQYIVAASENINFPASYMLDDLPKKCWESTNMVTDSFTITTNGTYVDCLFIGSTNATSGTVEVKDITETVTYETFSLSGLLGRFFIKFATRRTEILHIVVSLTVPETSAVSVGTVCAGDSISLPDPEYGLKQQREDYSIKKELSSGGMNVILRDMPRKYDLSAVLLYSEFDEIDALYMERGSMPVAMLLSDNMNQDDKWSGFFHMIDPPSSSNDYPLDTTVSMSLREAV